MVMSMLKASAIGALLSWMVVLAALGVLTWLGDFHAVAQRVSPFLGGRVALVIGLIFLTWRGAVINLCFVLIGNRWANQAPVLLLMPGFFGFVAVFILFQNGFQFDWLWNHFSELVAGLLALKFLLAFQGFHAALKRRLLAPSTVVGYLVVWILLVAAFLATLRLLISPDPAQVLPASLVIVLFVPLARIGFAPLALAWTRRHS